MTRPSNNCLECEKTIPEGVWCSTNCKKKFLLEHYDKHLTDVWFKEAEVKLK